MQPFSTPQTLYKYRSFDDGGYSLNILKTGHVWFSSADKLNDPFDSSLPYSYDILNEQKVRHWTKRVAIRADADTDKKTLEEMIDTFIDGLRNDPKELARIEEYYLDLNYSRYGVFSLTPHKDNLLMWSHYAESHTGFCIGFDKDVIGSIQQNWIRRKRLLSLEKITYARKVPKINFFNSMESDRWAKDLVKLLVTKSIDWKYEDEFRLLAWDSTNMAIDLSFDSISEIVLGCRISDDNREMLLRTISEIGLKAPVIQASRSKNKYELEFNQIA